MMGQNEFFGVYANSQLVTSSIALLCTFLLYRVLVFFGIQRFIWHPALFETAAFIIAWFLVLKFFG